MRAEFLLSTLKDFPVCKNDQGALLPEIALAGKSNVGKSSLINHLLKTKTVAKTSATPGKTKLLNFFLIDERFLLVDLPGYGFAKAPREEIETWSKAIDRYLNTRTTLKLLLLLVDCRRGIGEEDQSLLEWAEHKQIPILLILTKSDKLSRSELDATIQKLKRSVSCDLLPYSIMNNDSRFILEKKIEQAL